MDVAVRRPGGRATQEQLPRHSPVIQRSVSKHSTQCPVAYRDVGKGREQDTEALDDQLTLLRD